MELGIPPLPRVLCKSLLQTSSTLCSPRANYKLGCRPARRPGSRLHIAGAPDPAGPPRGHIVENLKTDELAATEAHRFTFVCAPLKLVGATGSPVRPLVLVPG